MGWSAICPAREIMIEVKMDREWECCLIMGDVAGKLKQEDVTTT